MNSKWIKTREAAEYVGNVQPDALYTWIKDGTLPKQCFTKIGTRYFFDRDELDAWLSNGGTEQRPQASTVEAEDRARTALLRLTERTDEVQS